MKTAISLPDDLYERATQEARRLGVSRSELFATATRRYLDEVSASGLTAQINTALPASGLDDSHRWAVAASAGILDRVEW